VYNELLHNPRWFLDAQGARDSTRREKCLRIKDPEIWWHLSEILLDPYKHFSSPQLSIQTDLKNPDTGFCVRTAPLAPTASL